MLVYLEGFIMCGIEMGSGGMIYVPSSMMSDSDT
jgi:hypothetical protein